jgi:hypothetical protein
MVMTIQGLSLWLVIGAIAGWIVGDFIAGLLLLRTELSPSAALPQKSSTPSLGR